MDATLRGLADSLLSTLEMKYPRIKPFQSSHKLPGMIIAMKDSIERK